MGKMSSIAERILLEPLRNRIAVNTMDGSVLVYIPEGQFEMGHVGDGREENRPKHRVVLSAYWIGVYAVTNAQYLKFLEAKGKRLPDNHRIRYTGLTDHPVVGVLWKESVEYAKWAGCELATEAQWEKACRGPLGLQYPWGKNWDAHKCRNDKNSNGRQGDAFINFTRETTTCAVYGYPSGASGYGTYNQSGNVKEWCGDWYDYEYYSKSPARDPRGPERGSTRVCRGGGWYSLYPDEFSAERRDSNRPDNSNVANGLRLVKTAL